MRYFTDWALAQLETLTDETVEPLDVETTLDLRMQRAAEQAIREQTPDGVQGALVALNHDGAVRVMIGGRDYVSSTYNRAVISARQPGRRSSCSCIWRRLRTACRPTTSSRTRLSPSTAGRRATITAATSGK
ncbi:hypothetical protein [Hankyongella ginsenosidimutans]|uniref:hypothetical protein n=1 Tax=Hankyongella ginsenosidimutans TaxID=1763828 RepID=UPI00319D99AD